MGNSLGQGAVRGSLDTRGGQAGGGNILQYWEQSQQPNQKLDTNLIRQFLMLPYVKVIIIALLITAMILVIIRLFKVRNPLKGRAVLNELEYLDKVKSRDRNVIIANNFIRVVTRIVEKSPFPINSSVVEYWNYNLVRANIRIPGGSRIMKAEEFHAVIVAVQTFVIGVGCIIAVLFSMPVGTMILLSALFLGNIIPMTYVRQVVKVKDFEIKDNFADFYLMIHYVILAGAGTPLTSIIKSYDKTTSSEEMHRFVDVCIHYMDTYGEYESTRYIASTYREIPEVSKLMRLIRQANEGGEIKAELMGFRNEIMSAKRYAISKRMDKLVTKAQASFNILMIVLVQAVMSAMAIYLEDLSLISALM